MKLGVFLIAGLYAWAFAGSWMRSHGEAVQNAIVDHVSTLRDLHALEQKQQRDYIAWLQGRAPITIVQADDAQINQYRLRLLEAIRYNARR